MRRLLPVLPVVALLLCPCPRTVSAEETSSDVVLADLWVSPSDYPPVQTSLFGPVYDTCADWTVTFDWLLLSRSSASSQDFLFDGAGNAVFNAADFDFGVQPGLRLSAIAYDPCGWDLEIGGFGTDYFVDSTTRNDPGITPVFYNGVPVNPATSYSAIYTSRLYSGEFNVRRRTRFPVTLLAGLRGMKLTENFDTLRGDAVNTGVFSETDNELFGAQVGAEAVVWTNGFLRVAASAKAGVFYNDAQLDARAANAAGTGITLNDSSHPTTYLGELNAGVVIPIWPVNLRVGYQLVWLDGVLLAPDQNDNFDIFTGAGNAEINDLVLHGAYVGLEATW